MDALREITQKFWSGESATTSEAEFWEEWHQLGIAVRTIAGLKARMEQRATNQGMEAAIQFGIDHEKATRMDDATPQPPAEPSAAPEVPE